jgi:hypothetical protein
MANPDTNTIPAWADSANYPSIEAMPDRWAWEFLRRNPEYCSDYEKALECGTSRNVRGSTAEKWGVHILRDPQEEYPHFPLFISQYEMNWIQYAGTDGGEPIVRYLSANQAIVPFNLETDLAPQFRKARRHLEKAQRSSKLDKSGNARRIRPKEMLEKLQIWEAKRCGATNLEIAQQLWTNQSNTDQALEKRVNRRYRAAAELIEGGYLELVRLD